MVRVSSCWLILAGMVGVLAYAPNLEAIPPRRLVEVVDIANLVASPDGRHVAFRTEQASIERNTYDTVWYVQQVDGGLPPRRLADGGTLLRDTAGISLPIPAVWSPDGRWIYYRALVGGEVDVWKAAVDGSGARALTLDPADVREFTLSPDGATLLYSVGASREEVLRAELDEYERGIRLDETVPIGGQGLFRSGHVEGRAATQRFTGTWFDRGGLLAGVPEQWRALDLTTGNKRDVDAPIVPQAPAAVADVAEVPWKSSREPGGERVAVLKRVGEDPALVFKPTVELSLIDQARTPVLIPCEAEPCVGRDITAVAWRPGSDDVLFTTTDGKRGRAQSIHRWNVATGAVDLVVRSGGLVNGGRSSASSCAVSFDTLVCVAAEASRPPRLERIDLHSGERRMIFTPNASLDLQLEQMVQVELLEWTDAGGQAFTGQFFRAREAREEGRPLFVTYYSCSGFLRGGVGDEWPLASLAERGVSALCINYAPLRNEASERFNQGLSAVQSAVALLSKRGDVDPAKVGMGGLSFGSEVALWVAMKSDLLAAVSVASPVVSPTYYLLGTLKGDEFVTGLGELWALGAPSETPERWKEISPAFNLDRIHAPVLMQLPEQEYIQGLDYAIPLIRSLKADLYVFPDEPHQKFQPRHKLAVYERNLDWFRYWLQGYESGDPQKQKQYSHWRTLSP